MIRETGDLPISRDTTEQPMVRDAESSRSLDGNAARLPDDSGEKQFRSELPNDSGEAMPKKFLDAKNETYCTGGSYKDVKKQVDANEKEDVEVHHMPADSASRLDHSEGPAIEMEKADHRLTASCGNSREAIEYRAKQRSLIESGDFRGAVQMDIDDIRSKFGNKYDGQIKQMLSYVDKLKEEGKI